MGARGPLFYVVFGNAHLLCFAIQDREQALYLPTLHFAQQSLGLPGNVIYADDLFEAAKHRGDSDFIL